MAARAVEVTHASSSTSPESSPESAETVGVSLYTVGSRVGEGPVYAPIPANGAAGDVPVFVIEEATRPRHPLSPPTATTPLNTSSFRRLIIARVTLSA